MTNNTYFCFIDEKKLTEIEWNKIHAEEVANHDYDMYGYYHCDSYTAYSESFDRCMAEQVERRGWLREWYVKLMKKPFTDKWAEEISDFSDSYKGVYGRRPEFYDAMLSKKGLTRKDISDAWKRLDEAYEANSTIARVKGV